MKLYTILPVLFGFPIAILGAPVNSTVARRQSDDSLINTADFDSHCVTTSDGYTLNLLHLTRGFTSKVSAGVVHLQHGLFDSSDTWLLNGPESSLAYILANEGYDVWLGNSRGNQYSPATDSQSKFSWDEMGSGDLPAFIEFIQEQTDGAKVSLIGHSQGAVEILGSLIDGYISPDVIAGVVTLGPPAQLKNQGSDLFAALGKMHVDYVVKLIPSGLFTPTLNFFSETIGDLGFPYDAGFQFIFGETELLDGSNYSGHFPAPTSGQNLAHWIQSARTGRFQHFEPSSLANADQAPAYDPTAIPVNSVKIATFIGRNDLLATVADIEGFLNPALEANGNLAKTQTFDGYAHMDFTWSLDAPKTVYPVVLEFLKSL